MAHHLRQCRAPSRDILHREGKSSFAAKSRCISSRGLPYQMHSLACTALGFPRISSEKQMSKLIEMDFLYYPTEHLFAQIR